MAYVDRLRAFHGCLSTLALVIGSILSLAFTGLGVVLGCHRGDLLLFSLG